VTAAESAIMRTLEIVPLADTDDVLRLHPTLKLLDVQIALSQLIAAGKVARDGDEPALFRSMWRK
jgi:hypothetical protein